MTEKKLVVEWLEGPHDDNSILVVRGPKVTSESVDLFRDELKRCGVDNLVIFLNAQEEIRFVSEQEMNEYGWYKRVEDEKNEG